MGDHRASIKIEVEFHGVKRSTDMYINWCEPWWAVQEWFEQVHRDGMDKWDEKQYEYEAEQRERDEKKLYEKLHKKFGE